MGRTIIKCVGGPRDGYEEELTRPGHLPEKELLLSYKHQGTQMMGIARYVRTSRTVGQRGRCTYIYTCKEEKSIG